MYVTCYHSCKTKKQKNHHTHCLWVVLILCLQLIGILHSTKLAKDSELLDDILKNNLLIFILCVLVFCLQVCLSLSDLRLTDSWPLSSLAYRADVSRISHLIALAVSATNHTHAIAITICMSWQSCKYGLGSHIDRNIISCVEIQPF